MIIIIIVILEFVIVIIIIHIIVNNYGDDNITFDSKCCFSEFLMLTFMIMVMMMIMMKVMTVISIFFSVFFFNCLVGCFSMTVWTPAVLSVLHACVSYFCICPCSVQLSMCYMERCSRNTLIIIIIIINTCRVSPPAGRFPGEVQDGETGGCQQNSHYCESQHQELAQAAVTLCHQQAEGCCTNVPQTWASARQGQGQIEVWSCCVEEQINGSDERYVCVCVCVCARARTHVHACVHVCAHA